MTPIEADDAGAPPSAAQLAMEQVCTSIWRLTEEVLELLRSQATSEVQRQKRPDILWVDDVTRAQSNTVIAVRQLAETYPEGITLKKLAETIGVTPAATSVMVRLLVKKRMLRRTRSRNDRRSILIRLTPETSGLFDISERSLGQSVMGLADSLGPEALGDWQRILVTASAALRQLVGARIAAESGLLDPPFEGDDESTREADAYADAQPEQGRD